MVEGSTLVTKISRPILDDRQLDRTWKKFREIAKDDYYFQIHHFVQV